MTGQDVKKNFKDHRAVAALCFGAFAFVLLGFISALVTLGGATQDSLILHFDNAGGITNIGSIGTLIFMGCLGLLVVVMNFIIALGFDGRDRFLGKWLAAMTLVFAVLLFIAFTAILNANV